MVQYCSPSLPIAPRPRSPPGSPQPPKHKTRLNGTHGGTSVKVELRDDHVEGAGLSGGLDDGVRVVKREADELLRAREQVGVAQPRGFVEGEVVVLRVGHHVRHLQESNQRKGAGSE